MLNLTKPQAVLIGLSLIALAVLFQPTMTKLLIPPAQAQSLVSDHEILKADHQAIKTILTNLAFAVEHTPACK